MTSMFGLLAKKHSSIFRYCFFVYPKSISEFDAGNIRDINLKSILINEYASILISPDSPFGKADAPNADFSKNRISQEADDWTAENAKKKDNNRPRVMRKKGFLHHNQDHSPA